MSAAMGSAFSGRFGARLGELGTRERGIIKGVCARLAERAGLPVWVPRLAFLIFGVLHWLVAIILYVVLTRILCRNRLAISPVQEGPPPSAVRDRFGALDARLAAMEATTLQQETTLRRAFRDLERS